ncbi:putative pectinesterase [Lupinus albus]|uniref:Pectinesterase n=1 Tax=Lupinus albus TaxID=3870 RepID=A0A6A4NQB0_LUPAL|nr:putative pectinesterase [Lupinus albus]
MATNLLKISTTFYTLLSFFILFLSPSLEAFSFSPNTTCNLTPYPTFCKTTMPSQYSSIHDQCNFFLIQSLSITKTIIQEVSSYLRDQSYIPLSTTHALEDCLYLAQLNIDFLSNVLQAIENTVISYQAYNFQTILGAILTNQNTCLDGFHEVAPYPRITTPLSNPLSEGIKLYSIALALFTHGYVSDDATGKLTFNNNNKLLQKISIVDNVMVRQKVVVNLDGSGNFTTINDAVDAAPNNTGTNNGYYVIYVVTGVYNEYVSIPKSKQNVMIIGDGINCTVITGNRSVVDGWTTFQSATFAVVGEGFVAVNISFRNTAGSNKHQAVAVRNGADMSTFYNCNFEGYQDTLYTHSFRQFYKNCNIYGTIDFIFGNSAAVFQDCYIYPRLPMRNQFNAITAQGRTDPNQNTGISIQNCYIVASYELGDATNNYNKMKTYLGRPWKEYSRTVYMETFIDKLIDPKGWMEWSGNFGLSTLYYAEFSNWGPGSNTSKRVTWEGYHLINGNDAHSFTVYKFIRGDRWLPRTGVPFKAGLH